MEKFSRTVALENQSLTDAYRGAYDTAKMQPTTVQSEASKLAAHPEVAARIQVLSERAQAAAIKKAGLTLEASMAEAGELLEDAKSLGQISAGVAAATLRAKLAGHLSERKEEKRDVLDDIDVAILLQMRDEVVQRLQRAKDKLALEDAQRPPGPDAPTPFRRVIE